MGGATLDNFRFVIERAVANSIQYLNGGGLPAADAVLVPQGVASKPGVSS
jgi:hypothetical protein